MGATLCDLLWIFSVLFGIAYGRFVAGNITTGEFWIAIILIYVGGQWILDRRAQIIIDQKDIEDAVKEYLDEEKK